VPVNQAIQSGLVEFRPRARLLKLIGAELISDDVVAITEVVKNAHDADASAVTAEFHGVTGPRGEIIVRDDGRGMDLETLLGQWMEPAARSKSRPSARLTERGRRVLGEKGVGRFAADKLGRHLELISRRRGENREVRAVFDWDEYDTDALLLSDVKTRWELRSPAEISGHGTILRISGLRIVWNERMFRRLSTRLSRLLSPFREFDSFMIRIASDEFPQYSGELRADILDRSPYRIKAFFDGGQSVDVKFNECRTVRHPWNSTRDLNCGPVRIRLFAFDLETEAVARIGPQLEVRAWLKEWSGISIYRDGFRIWPYGEPHDDWLRLDQRRVNNPVVRLSNNQVVGFVEISRDGNPDLMDQTNREGLLHNPAYEGLRRLMYFVLQILEAARQAVRHPQTLPSSPANSRSVKEEKEPVADRLERLAGKAGLGLGRELRKIAERARAEATSGEASRRRLVESYSEFAALGHAAIGLSRSVQPELNRLQEACTRIRTLLHMDDRRALRGAVGMLDRSIGIIKDRVAMLAPIETGANQRRRTLDLPREILAFGNLMRPVLEGAGAKMEITVPKSTVLRIGMRPEALHRLFHILTTNSLEWLDGARKPRLRITARSVGDRCEIMFSDNWVGIPSQLGAKVFEPLFSGKGDGRGMGLAIARQVVEQHRGEIDIVADRRRRGTTIRILLPRKRSRATIHR
jgi:signal transduction histidine kinase